MYSFTADTYIALAALVVAVWALIYGFHYNSYSITISDTELTVEDGQKLIEFNVFNSSSRPITIKKIKLFKDQTLVTDNGFNPEIYEDKLYEEKKRHPDSVEIFGKLMPLAPTPIVKYPGRYTYSDNFKQSVTLPPFGETSFSYFVNTLPNKIEVSCNQNVGFFCKTKSFSVSFNHVD